MSVQSVSKISILCDHNPPTLQTDRRTDRRTDTMQSQYRAMHIVHRAVMIKGHTQSSHDAKQSGQDNYSAPTIGLRDLARIDPRRNRACLAGAYKKSLCAQCTAPDIIIATMTLVYSSLQRYMQLGRGSGMRRIMLKNAGSGLNLAIIVIMIVR